MKGSLSKLFQRLGLSWSFLPSQDDRKMLTGQNDAIQVPLQRCDILFQLHDKLI